MTLVLLGVGCAQTPKPPAVTQVYPAPPAVPRIQFLTALSGDLDLARNEHTLLRRLFGEPVAESTPLQKPYGLAAHNGRLYVCDTNRRDVFCFDFAAGTFAQWPHPGVELDKPVAIRINPRGEVEICDAGKPGAWLRFSLDGKLTSAVNLKTLREASPAGTPPMEFHPVGSADGPNGSVAVLNSAAHRLELIDPSTGRHLGARSSAGSGDGQLFRPNGLAQSADGSLFVSDPMNRRVLVLDAAGAPRAQIGEPGDQPGYIDHPRGLSVANDGILYLADAALQIVQMFDAQGQYLMSFGQTPDGSALPSPAGVCIDRSCLPYFSRLVAPGFSPEYLIFVSNQVGTDKILVYAFGHGQSALTAR